MARQAPEGVEAMSRAEQLAYEIALRRCVALSDEELSERLSFLDANIERLNAIQEWELRLLQEECDQ